MAARSTAFKPSCGGGSSPGPIALRVEPRRCFRLPDAIVEIRQPVELHRQSPPPSCTARAVISACWPAWPTAFPATRPSRFIPILQSARVGDRRNPRGGGRRFAGRADRRSCGSRAATDVDRRAFDLLETMTERRAAELQNQPGPHVEKAVAALQRAFNRQWAPGEERLMAELPRRIGGHSAGKTRRRATPAVGIVLLLTPKPDSQQRLDMACAWAKALWSYSRRQPALDLLQRKSARLNGRVKTRRRKGRRRPREAAVGTADLPGLRLLSRPIGPISRKR